MLVNAAYVGKGVTVGTTLLSRPRCKGAAQPKAEHRTPAWMVQAWELGSFVESRTTS